jgi:tRNA (guanine10-N2)-methyltransferase
VTPLCGAETSFKVCVDAFMKKLTMKEKVQKIENFDFLPLQGPVNLKTPDIIFSVFEFYGSDQNNLSDQPERIFFGRCVGEGRRDLITKYV